MNEHLRAILAQADGLDELSQGFEDLNPEDLQAIALRLRIEVGSMAFRELTDRIKKEGESNE